MVGKRGRRATAGAPTNDLQPVRACAPRRAGSPGPAAPCTRAPRTAAGPRSRRWSGQRARRRPGRWPAERRRAAPPLAAPAPRRRRRQPRRAVEQGRCHAGRGAGYALRLTAVTPPARPARPGTRQPALARRNRPPGRPGWLVRNPWLRVNDARLVFDCASRQARWLCRRRRRRARCARGRRAVCIRWCGLSLPLPQQQQTPPRASCGYCGLVVKQRRRAAALQRRWRLLGAALQTPPHRRHRTRPPVGFAAAPSRAWQVHTARPTVNGMLGAR